MSGKRAKKSWANYMGLISLLAGIYFGLWTIKLDCTNLNKECLLNLITKPSSKVIISGAFLSIGFFELIVPRILFSKKPQGLDNY